MTLNLSTQVEARLTAIAEQRDIDPETLVEKMINEQWPPEETAREEKPKSALTALLESWLAAAPTDPEEICKAEADLNEFLENLNRSRIDSGERPLFP